MKFLKSLAFAIAALAAASAFAAPPAKNTPAFLACEASAHGNWNQGVCNEARETLSLKQVPITFESLSAEMAKINKQDSADFVKAWGDQGPMHAASGSRIKR